MRVLVGLSGGIDSCVSAYLLKEMGYEVAGATMLIWKKDSPYPAPASINSCYSPASAEDKKEIEEFCKKLGIEYHILDCSTLFESTVLDNFRSEYMSARTPNPCIWCNAKIKFGALVDYAKEKGILFDRFATGHYARIKYDEEVGRYCLYKAKDERKDQSYFLYRLTQEQLSRTIFPLGDYLKAEVREIDVKQGFHTADMIESQDFYGGDYTDLLNLEDRVGNIVTSSGVVLGQHKGFWHYTIGQRRGLGIASTRPLYVLALDSVKNEVVVGFDEESEQHYLWAEDVIYSSRTEFEKDKIYTIKIRSQSNGQKGYVERTQSGFKVSFIESVKAITEGQSAVIYDGDMVVAGGIISRAK